MNMWPRLLASRRTRLYPFPVHMYRLPTVKPRGRHISERAEKEEKIKNQNKINIERIGPRRSWGPSMRHVRQKCTPDCHLLEVLMDWISNSPPYIYDCGWGARQACESQSYVYQAPAAFQ